MFGYFAGLGAGILSGFCLCMACWDNWPDVMINFVSR